MQDSSELLTFKRQQDDQCSYAIKKNTQHQLFTNFRILDITVILNHLKDTQ